MAMRKSHTEHVAAVEFLNAIVKGRLSRDESAENFAGNYMFMGYGEKGKPLFKSIATREYLV